MLALNVFGQNREVIDSLRTAVSEAKPDTNKVYLLNNLSEEYSQFSEDTTILYLKHALDLVRDLDNPKLKAYILCKLGKQHVFKSKFTEAMGYFDLAENILMVFPNDSIQADVYCYKALLYKKANQFEKADEQARKSLDIATRINDLDRISSVYIIYQKIHNGIGEPGKALEYAYKAYHLKIELKDTTGIAVAMHNLSHHYSLLGKHDSTLFYLKKSIAINRKSDNKKYLAGNYLNLGVLFYHLQQYDSAEVYYQLSMEISQQIGFSSAISSVRHSIAINSLAKGDTANALMQLHTITDSLGEPATLVHKADSYMMLAYIAKAQKRFEEAFTYHEKFKELDDEIKEASNTSLAKFLEVQMKYENQKNLLEISKQRIKINSHRKNIYIIILVCLIFVLGIVVWFVVKLMRAKAQTVKIRQQKLEEELEFRNREMTSHLMALMKKNEILGNISEDLLELEKKAVKTETRSMIKSIAQRIRKSQDVELWKEFDIRFKLVHNDFYDKLNKNYPGLSPAEKRLCAFLKMNMTTKDISDITGSTTNSIKTSRYRIRKKMNLSEHDNLVDFLSKL